MCVSPITGTTQARCGSITSKGGVVGTDYVNDPRTGAVAWAGRYGQPLASCVREGSDTNGVLRHCKDKPNGSQSQHYRMRRMGMIVLVAVLLQFIIAIVAGRATSAFSQGVRIIDVGERRLYFPEHWLFPPGRPRGACLIDADAASPPPSEKITILAHPIVLFNLQCAFEAMARRLSLSEKTSRIC